MQFYATLQLFKFRCKRFCLCLLWPRHYLNLSISTDYHSCYLQLFNCLHKPQTLAKMPYFQANNNEAIRHSSVCPKSFTVLKFYTILTKKEVFFCFFCPLEHRLSILHLLDNQYQFCFRHSQLNMASTLTKVHSC